MWSRENRTVSPLHTIFSCALRISPIHASRLPLVRLLMCVWESLPQPRMAANTVASPASTRREVNVVAPPEPAEVATAAVRALLQQEAAHRASTVQAERLARQRAMLARHRIDAAYEAPPPLPPPTEPTVADMLILFKSATHVGASGSSDSSAPSAAATLLGTAHRQTAGTPGAETAAASRSLADALLDEEDSAGAGRHALHVLRERKATQAQRHAELQALQRSRQHSAAPDGANDASLTHGTEEAAAVAVAADRVERHLRYTLGRVDRAALLHESRAWRTDLLCAHVAYLEHTVRPLCLVDRRRAAATTIQCRFRGGRCATAYRTLRRAAMLIQRTGRGAAAGVSLPPSVLADIRSGPPPADDVQHTTSLDPALTSKLAAQNTKRAVVNAADRLATAVLRAKEQPATEEGTDAAAAADGGAPGPGSSSSDSGSSFAIEDAPPPTAAAEPHAATNPDAAAATDANATDAAPANDPAAWLVSGRWAMRVCCWRAHYRDRLQRVGRACVVRGRLYRVMMERVASHRLAKMATRIQTVFRRHTAYSGYQEFKVEKRSAVTLQRGIRRYCQRSMRAREETRLRAVAATLADRMTLVDVRLQEQAERWALLATEAEHRQRVQSLMFTVANAMAKLELLDTRFMWEPPRGNQRAATHGTTKASRLRELPPTSTTPDPTSGGAGVSLAGGPAGAVAPVGRPASAARALTLPSTVHPRRLVLALTGVSLRETIARAAHQLAEAQQSLFLLHMHTRAVYRHRTVDVGSAARQLARTDEAVAADVAARAEALRQAKHAASRAAEAEAFARQAREAAAAKEQADADAAAAAAAVEEAQRAREAGEAADKAAEAERAAAARENAETAAALTLQCFARKTAAERDVGRRRATARGRQGVVAWCAEVLQPAARAYAARASLGKRIVRRPKLQFASVDDADTPTE